MAREASEKGRAVHERSLVFGKHCLMFGVVFGPGSVRLGGERSVRFSAILFGSKSSRFAVSVFI